LRFIKHISIWGAFIILILASLRCSKQNPVSQSLEPVTIHNSEDISSNQVWRSNETHIITRPISINNRAVLKIDPGTTIKFEQDASITIEDSAGIIADGDTKPIIFSANNQETGQWKYILFRQSANSDSCKLINCQIRNGGNDPDFAASIVCENSTPVIRGCEISNCAANGILLTGDCREIEFFNNTILLCNGFPVVTDACNVAFIGNNIYSTNISNAIRVMNNEIRFNDTWYAQPVPYQLANGLNIQNANLTLSPEIVLQFETDQSLTISNNGSIKANGTLSPIKFTGINNGYWGGIVFEYTANSANSNLIRCVIEKGGHPANIYLNEAVPEILDCTIQNSQGYGVYLKGSFSSGSFSNNHFINNLKGAISISARAISSLQPQIFQPDGTNFIEIRGGPEDGLISSDSRWKNYGVPYKVNGTIYIQFGTLTLESGLTLLMGAQSGFEVGPQGGLIADGSSNMIKIQGEQPTYGYWNYIYFSPSANAQQCQLMYCQIQYGGGNRNYPGMIYCDQIAPTIKNCFIEYSATWGIFLNGNITIYDIDTNIFNYNLYGNYNSTPN